VLVAQYRQLQMMTGYVGEIIYKTRFFETTAEGLKWRIKELTQLSDYIFLQNGANNLDLKTSEMRCHARKKRLQMLNKNVALFTLSFH